MGRQAAEGNDVHAGERLAMDDRTIKGLVRGLLLWVAALVLVGAIASGFEIHTQRKQTWFKEVKRIE